jgi:hypothetical protein
MKQHSKRARHHDTTDDSVGIDKHFLMTDVKFEKATWPLPQWNQVFPGDKAASVCC